MSPSKAIKGFAAPVADDLPDPEALRAFVGAAKVRSTTSQPIEKAETDEEGGRLKQFPLRITEAELAPLRWLAQQQDRSQQYVARKLFTAAVLEEARKHGYEG